MRRGRWAVRSRAPDLPDAVSGGPSRIRAVPDGVTVKETRSILRDLAIPATAEIKKQKNYRT